MKQIVIRKYVTLQLTTRVSLLTEIKLKDKSGRLKIYDKWHEGFGVIEPDPSTWGTKPSARVTCILDLWVWKEEIYGTCVNNPFGIWGNETCVWLLPESAIAMTGLAEDFSAPWYCENLANSFTKSTTDWADASLEEATSFCYATSCNHISRDSTCDNNSKQFYPSLALEYPYHYPYMIVCQIQTYNFY